MHSVYAPEEEKIFAVGEWLSARFVELIYLWPRLSLLGGVMLREEGFLYGLGRYAWGGGVCE